MSVGLPGHKVLLEVGGASVPVTGAATTGATTAWQITTAARRVMDPTVAITIYDNAVAVDIAADVESIDYLTGRIVFLAGVTGPVTVDYSYVPRYALYTGKSVDITVDGDVADTTTFDDGQWRTFMRLLLTASGEVESLDDGSYDLSQGDDQTWNSMFLANTLALISVDWADDGAQICRFWAIVKTLKTGAKVADLVMGGLSLQSTAQKSQEGFEVSVSIGPA